MQDIYYRMKGQRPPTGSDESAATVGPRAMAAPALAVAPLASGSTMVTGRANTSIRCVCSVQVEKGGMVQCEVGLPAFGSQIDVKE